MKYHTPWIVAVLTLAFVSIASADLITITDQTSPNDARVDSAKPNTIYANESDGNDVYMYNGNDYDVDGNFPIIQFDLGMPAGEQIASVSSATLTLRTRLAYPDDLQFRLTRLTEAFDETTVTFNNRPNRDDTTEVFYNAPTGGVAVNTNITIDVSDLLAENGEMQTFGLVIELTAGSDGKYVQLAELGDSNGTPSLSAQFNTSPIPEPNSLALLLAGGLMMVRRRHAA